MSLHDEWLAIEKLIGDIISICNSYINMRKAEGADNKSVVKRVIFPFYSEISERIIKFKERYSAVLTEEANHRLESFQDETKIVLGAKSSTGEQSASSVLYTSAQLQKFKSDFNYLISDLDAVAFRLTERSFLHLQQSICVDDPTRTAWMNAFSNREEKCEKLGAIHLLSHGIYSFKANTENGNTDLVLSEPVTEKTTEFANRTSEGLVLTEGRW
ncbi:MAG: hypothetical protein KUG82_07890 [Pseudomonadales bacterium]|nr:hypothetical protein [Pseudomonadales bacterium]